MKLSKIKVKNYRLLLDACINVDDDITLIVGRNNTAKTSLMDFMKAVIENSSLSYNDYPLCYRKNLYENIGKLFKEEYTYDEMIENIKTPAIEFIVDYSAEGDEDFLGAISPFIIDIDMDTDIAIIKAEYKLKSDKESLKKLLYDSYYVEGQYNPNIEKIKRIISKHFSKIFILSIYAVNPNDESDVQLKTSAELKELFPIYMISAERSLDEGVNKKESSLTTVISDFFNIELDETTGPAKELRQRINDTNDSLRESSNSVLSEFVKDVIGFGYPNAEELKLGVDTHLNLGEQIKNSTELLYNTGDDEESLPSNYNGLGYKNLIKIAFQLAEFAGEIKNEKFACIPLLLIEEPESHMHPQMQQNFAKYLNTFIEKLSDIHIQTFITSHSSHISNTFDFSKIRYAKRKDDGVMYKDLNEFANEADNNLDFIRKYLNITRCDLFFADKAIFIEGASERLLLPDMIGKCNDLGLFDGTTDKLVSQYYTIIEVGGAYAHKFIPFINFLDIPSLIITDIDPISGGSSCNVSEGESTSNATIKWWFRKIKDLDAETPILLSDIVALENTDKTMDNIHIEFQTAENSICGKSLEEAIRNVNRELYGLTEPVTESTIRFNAGNKKTEFALKLIYETDTYNIPEYIKKGLVWLNQKTLTN